MVHRKKTINRILRNYALDEPGEDIKDLFEVIDSQEKIIINLGRKIKKLRKQYRELQKAHLRSQKRLNKIKIENEYSKTTLKSTKSLLEYSKEQYYSLREDYNKLWEQSREYILIFKLLNKYLKIGQKDD